MWHLLLALLAPAVHCQESQLFEALTEDACQSDSGCGTALLQTANAGRERASAGVVARKPMKTLVINLDSRPDRWDYMQEQLKPLLDSGAIEMERLSGVNGTTASVEGELLPEHTNADIIREILDEWFKLGVSKAASGLVLKALARGEKWEDGEKGCTLSHVAAWKKVAAGTEPVLILEDDLVIMPELEEIIGAVPKMPEKADFIYLQYRTAFQGMLYLPMDPRKDGHSFIKSVAELPGNRTLWKADLLLDSGAYLLWPARAQQLLDARPFANSVGLTLTYMMHKGDIDGYAVYPAPVHQLSEPLYMHMGPTSVMHGDIIRGGEGSKNGGWHN